MATVRKRYNEATAAASAAAVTAPPAPALSGVAREDQSSTASAAAPHSSGVATSPCCETTERSFLPMFILIAIVSGLYAVFLWMNAKPALQHHTHARYEKALFLTEVTCLHLFGFMVVVNFLRCAMTSPGFSQWEIAKVSTQAVRENCREILDGGKEPRKDTRSPVHVYKPDRAHHCTKVGRTVLRMDHYCPWIRNCVGYYNYKYFFLLLFYGVCALQMYIVVMYPRFLEAFKSLDTLKRDFIIMLAWFVAAFTGMVITLFFTFHCWLASNGSTTIEYCEKQEKPEFAQSPYDIGLFHNLQQVLGPNPILWLIPTYIGFPTLRNEGGHLYDCRGESWPQFEGGRRPV